MLPFEFVIQGIPISQQASSRSKLRWKTQVAASARAAWPQAEPPVADNVRIKVVYFYDGAPLDTDNMLKPIQDALIGIVYIDDSQITDIDARKRNLNASFRVRGMSLALAQGFAGNSDFVHIYIEAAPDPQELIK